MGGVSVTKIDEIIDVFLFFKEVADVEDGFRESRGLEHGRRHCMRRLVQKELVDLTVSLLDDCLKNLLQFLPLFILQRNSSCIFKLLSGSHV